MRIPCLLSLNYKTKVDALFLCANMSSFQVNTNSGSNSRRLVESTVDGADAETSWTHPPPIVGSKIDRETSPLVSLQSPNLPNLWAQLCRLTRRAADTELSPAATAGGRGATPEVER